MTLTATEDRIERGAASPIGLDLDALEVCLATSVGPVVGSLRAELIAGGRSNLTYRVTDGATTWVVRRPPLGTLTPSAHDMGREYRVMTALHGAGVPVPRTFSYVESPSVIGAPFSVVEHVEGTVVRGRRDAAALAPEAARRATRALLDGLVRLHAIDHRAAGLDGFGRPEGFLARQVRRWREQWERVATREVRDVDVLHAWLRESVPPEGEVVILHGDYRLDNAIFAPGDFGRIAAIVDWEMSTIGDPLADLGLLAAYWDPSCAGLLIDGHAPSANPGFPDADALIEAYARATGRDVSGLAFYRALAHFKLAVASEAIHRRFRAGLTVGDGFETVGDAVLELAAKGLSYIDAGARKRRNG